MKYHLPLVLYDPECPLCLRFKQGLEYINKNLTFASVRDEEIYREFNELDPAACQQQIHLITPERRVLQGPAVVDYLLSSTPGVAKLAWLLDNEQGRKVKDFFYQKVEELRELTLKRDECGECPTSKKT
jgi:predicted DCC family thiol-disulfide oxidoreductase YuxK